MRPRGDSTRVVVEESGPHEYLLDPRHPFKEIRGTRYFEPGSQTLTELNTLTGQYIREYDLDFTHKSIPREIFVSGVISGLKYNSADINVFVREKVEAWKDSGYKIANMPPKLSTHAAEHREHHLLRHGIPLTRKPSVIYAYLGSNNDVVKGSLARALFELGLISFKEICIELEDGRWVMSNRWDYTEMMNHEK